MTEVPATRSLLSKAGLFTLCLDGGLWVQGSQQGLLSILFTVMEAEDGENSDIPRPKTSVWK